MAKSDLTKMLEMKDDGFLHASAWSRVVKEPWCLDPAIFGLMCQWESKSVDPLGKTQASNNLRFLGHLSPFANGPGRTKVLYVLDCAQDIFVHERGIEESVGEPKQFLVNDLGEPFVLFKKENTWLVTGGDWEREFDPRPGESDVAIQLWGNFLEVRGTHVGIPLDGMTSFQRWFRSPEGEWFSWNPNDEKICVSPKGDILIYNHIATFRPRLNNVVWLPGCVSMPIRSMGFTSDGLAWVCSADSVLCVAREQGLSEVPAFYQLPFGYSVREVLGAMTPTPHFMAVIIDEIENEALVELRYKSRGAGSLSRSVIPVGPCIASRGSHFLYREKSALWHQWSSYPGADGVTKKLFLLGEDLTNLALADEPGIVGYTVNRNGEHYVAINRHAIRRHRAVSRIVFPEGKPGVMRYLATDEVDGKLVQRCFEVEFDPEAVAF